jgi:hypothetical protein
MNSVSSSSPDNVYYDLVFTNFKSEKREPIQIQFNENRAKSIISNTGEYDLSIVSLSWQSIEEKISAVILRCLLLGNTFFPFYFLSEILGTAENATLSRKLS